MLNSLSRTTCTIFNETQIIKIIRLAFPALVEFALQSVVQYIDLYMVGELGVNATAVVGLGSQVQFLVKFPMTGMSIGVLSSIAMAKGRGDVEKIRSMAGQSLRFSAVVGIFFWFLSFVVGVVSPIVFHLDPELVRDFYNYYFICYSTTIFFSLSSTYGSVLKGVGDMTSPMVINGLVNILNIILNFVFIYRLSWGVKGAASGTAISVAVGGVMMLIAALRNHETKFSRNDIRKNREVQKQFYRIGLPAGFTYVSSGIGRTIFTSLISNLDPISVVAHFISMTVESIFYIPAVGIQRGVATLSGYYYGGSRQRELRRMLIDGSVITFLIMAVTGAALYALGGDIAGFFTDSEDAVKVSDEVLKIISFSEPIFGISIVFQAVLEGMGKTKETFLLSSFTMWLCRVVICSCVVYVFKGDLRSIWYCMIADNVLRAVLMYGRLKFKYLKIDKSDTISSFRGKVKPQ